MTTVTQADRDAAADIWRDYVAKVGEIIVENQMRKGNLDEGLPRILATFREAAEARARLEGAKAMQSAAIRAAFEQLHPHPNQPESDWTEYAKHMAHAATCARNAIAALDPAQIAGGKP